MRARGLGRSGPKNLLDQPVGKPCFTSGKRSSFAIYWDPIGAIAPNLYYEA